MSNITLSVDDEVIRKVRKIAIDKNTTLTQMVIRYSSTLISLSMPMTDMSQKRWPRPSPS
jgi:hypothetical protein